MRQFKRYDTICTMMCQLLVISLLFAPIVADIQAAESSGPFIASFPIRVGRFGQPFTVRVHAMSQSSIEKVTLIIYDEDKPLRGEMPRLNIDNVPVQAHAVNEAKIYAGSSLEKRVKAMVPIGELLSISSEQNGFYRVVTDGGVSGFILKSDVEVLKTGSAYAVTLPQKLTSRSILTYAIEAVDSRGRKTTTPKISMRLLTDEEIAGFITEYRGGQKGGKAIYKDKRFWLVALLAGGTAYYLTSRSDNKTSNQAAVQVLVEWE